MAVSAMGPERAESASGARPEKLCLGSVVMALAGAWSSSTSSGRALADGDGDKTRV